MKILYTLLFTLISCAAMGQVVYKCDVYIKEGTINVVQKPNHKLYRGFWGDDWILDNYKLGYKYFTDYNIFVWSNGNGSQPYDYYHYSNGGRYYKTKPSFKKVVIADVLYRTAHLIHSRK